MSSCIVKEWKLYSSWTPVGDWVHFCVPMEIADLGDKGKGLVVTEHVAKGTLICDPKRFPFYSFAQTEEDLRARLTNLKLEQRQELLRHCYCNGGYVWEVI